MKATGIVRRIDDLGRIVIPKEIRRTLRIRETDPMEIYTDIDGQIVLKKYSPMGDITAMAEEYVKTLVENTGMTAAITDRDHVIEAAKNEKKYILGKQISRELNVVMDERKSVMAGCTDKSYVSVVSGYECKEEVISPIICAGDVLGSVIMFTKDDGHKFTEWEKCIVKVAADFLGKHMES